MLQKTNTILSSEVASGSVDTLSQLNAYCVLTSLEDSNKILNLWRNYTIRNDITESVIYYDLYTVQASDWWDNIASHVYGSVHYWWTLCLMNNIINPFEELIPGMRLKVLKRRHLFQLLKEVKAMAGK